MARAESYGDIARLEQLLDEHANIAALDPAKLPAIRQQIWTLLTAAKMDHDLGLAERPDEEVFDDMLLRRRWLVVRDQDVQIRDGLHILGEAPVDDGEIDLVLAMLRARQLWAVRWLCRACARPSDWTRTAVPMATARTPSTSSKRRRATSSPRCHKGGWTDDAVADAAAGLPTAVADARVRRARGRAAAARHKW